MKQVYDYIDYWDGKRDLANYSLEKKQKIIYALKKLDFKTVLEYGPGQGQLTKLLLDVFDCSIIAIEIARRYCLQLPQDERLTIINEDALTATAKYKYDLVISAHFLLHVEPKYFEGMYKKMEDYSKKYIIHIDPIKENIHREWEYYNFPHDYSKTGEFTPLDKYSGLWLKEKN